MPSFVSVPSNIANPPKVVDFNDTDVTFQWITSNIAYNYSLERSNTSREYIYNIAEGIEVTRHINGLNPATNYNFTLYTEFFDVRSTGYKFSHTTSKSPILCIILIMDHISRVGQKSKCKNPLAFNS